MWRSPTLADWSCLSFSYLFSLLASLCAPLSSLFSLLPPLSSHPSLLSSLFSLFSLCFLPSSLLGTDPFLYHPALVRPNHCFLRPRDRPFSLPSRHAGIEPLHPSTYLSWSCYTAIPGTPLLLMRLSLRRRCCAVAVSVDFFFRLQTKQDISVSWTHSPAIWNTCLR